MKTPDDVSHASELMSAYHSLTWQLARVGNSGTMYVQLADDDEHTSAAHMPHDLKFEALGLLRGLVHAKLLQLGVDPDHTTEIDCIRCDGTGLQKKSGAS